MKLISVYRAKSAPAFLYELLRERSVERDDYVNISHRKLPTWAEHLRFIRSRTFRAWYLIEVEGEFVGYVSLTKLNEIGTIIMRARRGNGYGTHGVRLLMEKHKPWPAVPSVRIAGFIANVHPKNRRSVSMFKSLGFRLVQETYANN